MNFMRSRKILTCPTTWEFNVWAAIKFYCDFFKISRLRLKYFWVRTSLKREWHWKLALAAALIMFLNEFNLKLEGKTVLICEAYSVGELFQRQLMSESQVMLSYFTNFQCCQKLSQFSHKFVAYILSEPKLQNCNSVFRPWCKCKGPFHISKSISLHTEFSQPSIGSDYSEM